MWSAVDLRTTGWEEGGRIVEIGVVQLDEAMEEVRHWTTLINPGEYPGKVEEHGIAPAMVREAPAFTEVAAAVATLLEGTLLAAHNLEVVRRVLSEELERAEVDTRLGWGMCSWRATEKPLEEAAKAVGVEGRAVTALERAELVAGLIRELSATKKGWGSGQRVHTPELGREMGREMGNVAWEEIVAAAPVLRREEAGTDGEEARQYNQEAREAYFAGLDVETGWRSKPVTEAQARRLQSHGLDPRRYRNRGEASDAIGAAERDR